MLEASTYTVVSTNHDTLSLSIEKDKLRIALMTESNGSATINLNIPQIEFIMDILPGLRAKLD